jgi:gluconolactonase
MLATGKRTSNCEFGEDGSTLFITADDVLLRVPLATKGVGFE